MARIKAPKQKLAGWIGKDYLRSALLVSAAGAALFGTLVLVSLDRPLLRQWAASHPALQAYLQVEPTTMRPQRRRVVVEIVDLMPGVPVAVAEAVNATEPVVEVVEAEEPQLAPQGELPEAKPVPAMAAATGDDLERKVYARRIDNTGLNRTGAADSSDAVLVEADLPADENMNAVQHAAIVTAGLTGGLPQPSDVQPAWQRYAVAVSTRQGRPKIAVVLDDLGLSQSRTAEAIRLPAPLTMSFLPYADNLPDQTAAAHKAGHELMVHVPMEPLGADNDPGPRALLTTLPEAELLRRLRYDLTRCDGYVGINNHMGSKFTSDPKGMMVVLTELKKRGLLFLDSQTIQSSVAGDLSESLGLPTARRSVFIDHDQSAEAVQKSLAQLEVTARHFGMAVGIGHPHRVTLEALQAWLPGLQDRGFDLVPISRIAAEKYSGKVQFAERQ
jgi:uncharacterized protein